MWIAEWGAEGGTQGREAQGEKKSMEGRLKALGEWDATNSNWDSDVTVWMVCPQLLYVCSCQSIPMSLGKYMYVDISQKTESTLSIEMV